MEIPKPGNDEVGGVDIRAGNAGARPAASGAAPPSSSYAPLFWVLWMPPLLVGFVAGFAVCSLLGMLHNAPGAR
jgi:hypothetical protein